jgi:hypothetical protein
MRKTLAGVAAALLVVPCLLFGQEKPQSAVPSKNSGVEQELIKLEQQGDKAALNRDVAYFTRTASDDFLCTDPGGIVTTKEQGIADMKAGVFQITSLVSDDYKVRVYGKAAVVTYRSTIKAEYKGEDISGQYRWTDTWVKQGKSWQCVASHGSKIAGTIPLQSPDKQ